MSKLPVHHASAAERDLVGLVVYLAKDSAQAALRLANAVDVTLSLVSNTPFIGEEFTDARLPALRRVLVTGFESYSVYYRAFPDYIQVIRVLHNSRDIEKALKDNR